MREYIYILLFTLSSCSNNRPTEHSLKELIQTTIKNNNYTLSTYNEENKIVKEIKKSSMQEADGNLELVAMLLKLNNANPLKYSAINAYINQHNSIKDKSCQISKTTKPITNDVEYYNELSRVIKASCLSVGAINVPRMAMNFTVSGNTFSVKKGDKLQIPVKAFPQRTIGTIENILFDTLNFKAASNFRGYYEINSSSLKLGNNRLELRLYGKDLYTGRVAEVGNIDCTIEVYDH